MVGRSGGADQRIEDVLLPNREGGLAMLADHLLAEVFPPYVQSLMALGTGNADVSRHGQEDSARRVAGAPRMLLLTYLTTSAGVDQTGAVRPQRAMAPGMASALDLNKGTVVL